MKNLNKVLHNGRKYPQDNFFELIYNYTNAYCEILYLNFLMISPKWLISGCKYPQTTLLN